MGYRAHVHTKHDIEYGHCHFNWQSGLIHDWLIENGVDILGDDNTDFVKVIYDAKSWMRQGIRDWAKTVMERRHPAHLYPGPEGYYEFPGGGFSETGDASGTLTGWKPIYTDDRVTDVEFIGTTFRGGNRYIKRLDYLDTDTLMRIYGACKGGMYYAGWNDWI